ncbi:BMP family ABC transporter substrate-binding protein (plasmid) [Borrelia coriaceae]|nr:BMP family ABC transporter substrate-binding protein [Borrelia coriaceae]UPA17248.1 BMP family ABC transporter substrate-binding protein [Borrelia coriaceae]
MSKSICLILFFFISCFATKESSDDVDKKFVMGMLFPANYNDNGYLQNSFEGASSVSNVFGIKFIPKVVTPYPIESNRLMTFDEVLTEDILALQKEGANFIWFVSSYFSESSVRFAYENPHIFYAIVDDLGHNDMDKLPKNLLSIIFRLEEGAFLAGYIASKMSKSNKLGFVTGASIMRNVKRFLVGFRAGAFYENSKTRVILKRVLKDRDEAVGEDIAKYMYIEDGIDVIFPVMGPAVFGIFRIAKELGPGHYVIGVNKDQSHLAHGHVITSVIRNLGKAISDCSSDIIKSHNFNFGGVVEKGIKEGIIDVIKDSSIIGKDLVDKLTKLKEDIVSGELVIPSTDYELDLFKEKLKR